MAYPDKIMFRIRHLVNMTDANKLYILLYLSECEVDTECKRTDRRILVVFVETCSPERIDGRNLRINAGIIGKHRKVVTGYIYGLS